jgi:hypothetical protein
MEELLDNAPALGAGADILVAGISNFNPVTQKKPSDS